MSKYFSYIDTALRVIYINKQSSLDDDARDGLTAYLENADTSHHIKMDMLQRRLISEMRGNPKMMEVVTHEFHHYLQGLFYPFLYYLNWLEFENLMELRHQFQSGEKLSYPINALAIGNRFANNLTYTSKRFQLYWENDRLFMKIPEFLSPENQVFSLNDLLEDVTSIFQYKLSVSNPNHADYYRWIKNPVNRNYKRLYLFMVRHVGTKYTYDLLPLLVQAAFSTTEPIGGFCNAVGFINYRLPNYENLSAAEIFDSIMKWLGENLGALKTDLSKTDTFMDTEVCVIDHKNIEPVIKLGIESKEMLHYPLAVHARKFRGEMEKNPELLYYLFNIDAEKHQYLENEFNPMAIRYMFLDMKGRDALLVVGKDFLTKHTPDKMPYPFYIRELMKLKEVTQAIFTNVQEHIPHHCHHTSCDYYPIGLCRNWTSIPTDHNHCGFPAWFAYVFKRSINLTDLSYDKISVVDSEAAWEEYRQKSFRRRNFNYVTSPGGFTLSIGKGDFEHEEKKHMLRDFINYLKEEKMLSGADLAGTITLDFYGFDNDPRPLFQIPQVKKWMVDTLKNVPELLCYINFCGASFQSFILVPAFVKHEIISTDRTNYVVKFDPEDHMNFLLEQMKIFKAFIAQNPGVEESLLIANFKKIFDGN